MSVIPSLAVSDVSATVDFYRYVLGFELVGVTGKGGMTRARIRLGDTEILFRSSKKDGIRQALRFIDPDDRPVFHIKVNDIAHLYHRVRGKAPIVRELETTLFGFDEFAIEDPDGLVVSFSQAHGAGAAQRTAHRHEEGGQSRGEPRE